ncbi:hypothetical protein C482_02806 [Natrialba chahannaoensis JCM 10990]|uniref:Uncharacterized protein n=1 Tax=Natrialba chahannaoensis JCM 10990 TaxID=1227492 RepID=M0B602_9EURY|nr:hypothetical protein [Natrialba chahannaoensis]ELZ05049.1 hypothetical protein C482_02806 [Natrialba chahannaoensis JCM 10990]
MTPESTSPESIELVADEQTVELEKLQTPSGERVIIRGSSAEIRVDALALESLTWQEPSFFEALTGVPHEEDQRVIDESGELRLSNEYTVVTIRLLEADAGPRIALASPKLGYACRLSPIELDTIAQQETGFFSDLLETPLGPEDDHHHGVH